MQDSQGPTSASRELQRGALYVTLDKVNQAMPSLVDEDLLDSLFDALV